MVLLKWELLNGGRVFESLSTRILTFMDKQVIPVPNVIPRVLLDVIARLVGYESPSRAEPELPSQEFYLRFFAIISGYFEQNIFP